MPTATARKHAFAVSLILPMLQTTDVVFAVLPDGEECLVKGRSMLERIAAGTDTVSAIQARIPVLDIEMAIALQQELGSDGNLMRRIVGDTLYGQVGHG